MSRVFCHWLGTVLHAFARLATTRSSSGVPWVISTRARAIVPRRSSEAFGAASSVEMSRGTADVAARPRNPRDQAAARCLISFGRLKTSQRISTVPGKGTPSGESCTRASDVCSMISTAAKAFGSFRRVWPTMDVTAAMTRSFSAWLSACGGHEVWSCFFSARDRIGLGR